MSDLCWERFGAAVRWHRMREDEGDPISLREFAKRYGVNKATLSRVESGRPCDVGTYLQLCLVCDIPPFKITVKP